MRTVSVTVRSKDRIGLVNEIARVIFQMGLPIVESRARTYMNRRTSVPESEFTAVIAVPEEAQDAVLLSRLRKIKGCIAVTVSESRRFAA